VPVQLGSRFSANAFGPSLASLLPNTLAKSLLVAHSIIEEGELGRRREDRYAGWNDPAAADILNGKISLQQIHDDLLASGHEPEPVSGRQELLERLIARHIDTAT